MEAAEVERLSNLPPNPSLATRVSPATPVRTQANDAQRLSRAKSDKHSRRLVYMHTGALANQFLVKHLLENGIAA